MAKKKKKQERLEGPAEGFCHRKINDAEYCQNPRRTQACYVIECNDELKSHAFITPCAECEKTVLKRKGFMGKEEFHEWARSKWPTIIEHAVKQEQLRHK